MQNENSGKIFTSLEPEPYSKDTCLCPNSGMLLAADETPKSSICYIPVWGLPQVVLLLRSFDRRIGRESRKHGL